MIKLEVIALLLLIGSIGLKKHALTALLTLEILRLFIIIITLIIGIDIFFGLIMICIGACEGAVGLATLIGNTRVRSLKVC